jgi:hypothetical protein
MISGEIEEIHLKGGLFVFGIPVVEAEPVLIAMSSLK